MGILLQSCHWIVMEGKKGGIVENDQISRWLAKAGSLGA